MEFAIGLDGKEFRAFVSCAVHEGQSSTVASPVSPCRSLARPVGPVQCMWRGESALGRTEAGMSLMEENRAVSLSPGLRWPGVESPPRR